jgi:hypothetical protein
VLEATALARKPLSRLTAAGAMAIAATPVILTVF